MSALNGLFRFGLELCLLGSLGYWGYRLEHPVLRWVATFGAPPLAATLWGVFAVPDDPSRSGQTVVVTPGWIRLLLELGLFAAAAAALHHSVGKVPAGTLLAGVVLHYVVAYERLIWLFRH